MVWRWSPPPQVLRRSAIASETSAFFPAQHRSSTSTKDLHKLHLDTPMPWSEKDSLPANAAPEWPVPPLQKSSVRLAARNVRAASATMPGPGSAKLPKAPASPRAQLHRLVRDNRCAPCWGATARPLRGVSRRRMRGRNHPSQRQRESTFAQHRIRHAITAGAVPHQNQIARGSLELWDSGSQEQGRKFRSNSHPKYHSRYYGRR